MIRLLLVDDHTVVLQGLKALLEVEDDIRVAGMCTDGEEGVQAVGDLQPDVVVMDTAMPNMDGIEAVERIRASGSQVPILMLSATLDDASLARCLELEVDGILLKDAAAESLLDAIRTIHAGESWMSDGMRKRTSSLGMIPTDALARSLTPREREVVTQIVAGHSNKKAARKLGITVGTVKLHLYNIYRKLDVSNRLELAILAQKEGWSPGD